MSAVQGLQLNAQSFARLHADAYRRGETKMMSARQIEELFRAACADGINAGADEAAGIAIDQTPLEWGELRGSFLYPAIDDFSAADLNHLEAEVSANTVYAAAQEAGFAWMTRGTTSYEWKARHYTTPGTGPHFLESALKAMARHNLERKVGEEIAKVFG